VQDGAVPRFVQVSTQRLLLVALWADRTAEKSLTAKE